MSVSRTRSWVGASRFGVAAGLSLLLLFLASSSALAQTASPPPGAGAAESDELLKVLQEHTGPVPPQWPTAAQTTAARDEYLRWYCAHLRSNYPEELRKLARRKSIVPPLTSAAPDPQPPMIRLDLPVFGDAGHRLDVAIGKPKVEVAISAEGKALSVLGANYKTGVSYNFANKDWAVVRTAEVRAGLGTEKVEASVGYQFYASEWGAKPSEPEDSKPADFAVKIYDFAASYNSEHELAVGLSHDLVKTPHFLSSALELAMAIEGQFSAPISLTHVYSCEDDAAGREAARAARILAKPQPCPHCGQVGELHCGQCNDQRTIVCTRCGGKGKEACTRCEGGGQLICPRCNQTGQETCHNCGGSGQLRCGTCGGSGSVTRYESEMRSRQELVITSLGFDSAGQPVYERHYETRYYTEQVPHRDTCGSCGGSGRGGQCGSCDGSGRVQCGRCGGSGIVGCNRCGATGWVACGTCDGRGRITCPTCHGRPIICPVCRGNKHIGG